MILVDFSKIAHWESAGEKVNFQIIVILNWCGWVLEPSELSSKGFVALVTNPANPAKTWLFICFNEPS